MKNRNRDAIGQAILVLAVCGLAAVGFDYIMEISGARHPGLQRTSAHGGATAAEAAH
jgi:hypothetical protein